jgi:hypothetical protein
MTADLSLCPVYGNPDLTEPPRSRSGGGSYGTCGFECGVSDAPDAA